MVELGAVVDKLGLVLGSHLGRVGDCEGWIDGAEERLGSSSPGVLLGGSEGS
jgi:hypothetical protein